jgi:hypothetical protein
MASEATDRASINVGPNFQVSLANGTSWHREVQAAADPTDPKRLFVVAIAGIRGGDAPAAVLGYRSEDGGKSWQQSFLRDRPDEFQYDITTTFGPDGTLYVEYNARAAPDLSPTEGATPNFHFFRSSDAGAAWEDAGVIREGGKGAYLDRPYITVDGTDGPNRGRLYCASLLRFHASEDRGQTFKGHKYEPPEYSVAPDSSNPVVLSDGTVIFAYRDWRQDRRECPGLGVLESDDGGRTIREAGWVRQSRNQPSEVGNLWFSPQLGVDAAGGRFRDRVYAVWDDGNGPLRVRVLFAYSDDKGKTWTGPTVISEQPADGSAGYSAHMPAVAVNRDGVVAVRWYDRRGLPDVRGVRPPFYGPGCNVRVRVSLDGGATWQPSVQVNEAPIKASVWELRDNANIVAGADGKFHAFWADDRTGVLQVWTAEIGVSAR